MMFATLASCWNSVSCSLLMILLSRCWSGLPVLLRSILMDFLVVSMQSTFFFDSFKKVMISSLDISPGIKSTPDCEIGKWFDCNRVSQGSSALVMIWRTYNLHGYSHVRKQWASDMTIDDHDGIKMGNHYPQPVPIGLPQQEDFPILTGMWLNTLEFYIRLMWFMEVFIVPFLPWFPQSHEELGLNCYHVAHNRTTPS